MTSRRNLAWRPAHDFQVCCQLREGYYAVFNDLRNGCRALTCGAHTVDVNGSAVPPQPRYPATVFCDD